jgi:hypothetical protein
MHTIFCEKLGFIFALRQEFYYVRYLKVESFFVLCSDSLDGLFIVSLVSRLFCSYLKSIHLLPQTSSRLSSIAS